MLKKVNNVPSSSAVGRALEGRPPKRAVPVTERLRPRRVSSQQPVASRRAVCRPSVRSSTHEPSKATIVTGWCGKCGAVLQHRSRTTQHQLCSAVPPQSATAGWWMFSLFGRQQNHLFLWREEAALESGVRVRATELGGGSLLERIHALKEQPARSLPARS